MTPTALISRGLSFGVTLSVASSGKLKVSYDGEPPPANFVDALKASKADVIAFLQSLETEHLADVEPSADVRTCPFSNRQPTPTVELAVSGKPLATACIVCGRICTGTRPDIYVLVDPADQAGPRVHVECLEGGT